MLLALRAKGCIRELDPGEEAFYSRVFLMPKRTGGHIFLIYISTLNNYLSPVLFQMDMARIWHMIWHAVSVRYFPRVRGSCPSIVQTRFTTSLFARRIRYIWNFK